MHGTNPVAVQLANLLAELAPGDLSAVKFQCGGSEVTEAAIKLARQYHRLTGSPGKFKVSGAETTLECEADRVSLRVCTTCD